MKSARLIEHINNRIVYTNDHFSHTNAAFVQTNAAFVQTNAAFAHPIDSFVLTRESFDNTNGSFVHAINSFVYTKLRRGTLHLTEIRRGTLLLCLNPPAESADVIKNLLTYYWYHVDLQIATEGDAGGLSVGKDIPSDIFQ